MDQLEEQGVEPDIITREMIESKLKEAQKRLEKYKGYQELMEQTGHHSFHLQMQIQN
jgi:transposase